MSFSLSMRAMRTARSPLREAAGVDVTHRLAIKKGAPVELWVKFIAAGR
jgi:hypothetical protein